MNEVPMQGIWKCPSCNEENSTQSEFCKNCGYSQSQQPKSRRNPIWFILIIFLVLAMLGAAGYFGYSFYQKKQEEAKTKVFLDNQQNAFGELIKSINGLATETDLNKKYADEENTDLTVSKISEELLKAEKNLELAKSTNGNYVSVVPTETIQSVHYLIKSFYADAEKFSGKYSEYLVFLHSESKITAEMTKEAKKFQQKFPGDPKTIEEAISKEEGYKEYLQKIVSLYDELKTPEQLNDYKKFIDEYKNLIEKVDLFIKAIKAKDINSIKSVGGELEALEESCVASFNDAQELINNYYSQIHDEFVSLRNSADKIKNEFTVLDAKSGVQPPAFSIEGW